SSTSHSTPEDTASLYERMAGASASMRADVANRPAPARPPRQQANNKAPPPDMTKSFVMRARERSTVAGQDPNDVFAAAARIRNQAFGSFGDDDDYDHYFAMSAKPQLERVSYKFDFSENYTESNKVLDRNLPFNALSEPAYR